MRGGEIGKRHAPTFSRSSFEKDVEARKFFNCFYNIEKEKCAPLCTEIIGLQVEIYLDLGNKHKVKQYEGPKKIIHSYSKIMAHGGKQIKEDEYLRWMGRYPKSSQIGTIDKTSIQEANDGSSLGDQLRIVPSLGTNM
jgi:hypothetical protein